MPRPALARPARVLAAVAGAVDALAAVALPFGALVVVALIAWAGLGATAPWSAFLAAAADAWLLGHGVDLDVVVAGHAFPVTLAAIGPALVTVGLGVRAGRRAATSAPGPAVAAALLTTVGASLAVARLGTAPAAQPSLVQAALLPAALLGLGLLAGLRLERGPLLPGGRLGAGLRAGAGAVAVVLAASAVAVTTLLLISLAPVLGLYESLGAGPAGGLAVTALEVLLLPTVVVWGLAWFSGAGFALGAGSSVGPLGTAVGPLPSLPLLGALPHPDPALGLLGLLVPVLAGFGCAFVAQRRAGAGASALATGPVAGVVAAAGAGLLTATASGAAGPGRFATVGPDALVVAGLVLLEVGVPATLGALAGRVRATAPEEAVPEAAETSSIG